MQINKLSPQFQPYIINNQVHGERGELCTKLDEVFRATNELSMENGFQSVGDKAHVVTHPNLKGWIIKGERNDQYASFILPGDHIYRLDKALKIQEVIQKKGFTELVLPKKYLYQAGDKWFVIAEKLDLDTTVTSNRQHIDISRYFLESDPNRPQRVTFKPLSVKQAHELATICFAGLEDVTAANINFDKKGRVAIVDTEPLSLKILKKFDEITKYKLRFGLRETIKFTSCMANAERLFLLCSSEGGAKAREEVRKVQSSFFWKHTAKILSMAALPLIAALGILYKGIKSSATIRFSSYLLVGIAGLNALSGLYNFHLTISNYLYVRSYEFHFHMANG
jgi:hypothetical protein